MQGRTAGAVIKRGVTLEQSDIPIVGKKSDVKHILIVDDEVEFVSSVKRHLKREGFHADFALNGKSACVKMLAMEENQRFYDLVITDVVMPEMDGLSLIKWIHDTFPQTSVMVVSEFMDIVHMEKKIRPELDDIGRKPMTPASMMQLIHGIRLKRGKLQ